MSMKLDVSKVRPATIAMNELSGVDAVYFFFYDETNNIRRLSMESGKFSVPDTHNFVLGGIVRELPPSNSDAETLIQSLSLQRTTKELKTKHIGTGGFQNLIKSKKLKLILEWLNQHGYFIHFVNLNVVYWSVADIIDSIIMTMNSPEMVAINGSLKSDLYELIKSDEEKWLNFLSQYNYPNIGKNDVNPFLEELVKILKEQIGTNSVFRYKMLLDIFKLENVTELVFLDGNQNGVLIDNFLPFYLQPFWLFKNSNHMLDNESTIESSLEGSTLTYQDEMIENYTFCDSKDDLHIQISDVITGVLGKLFSFAKDSKMSEISEFRLSLDGTAAENMELLTGIMKKTLTRSRGFHLHIISEGEHKRLQTLLYTE